MLRRLLHPVTRRLTGPGLVVASAPRGRGRLGLALALALAAGAGAAATLALVLPAADTAEREHWQQLSDQQRLALMLSEAHAQELERQIDSLNQQLRASQEELTFFRRARETKP